MEFSNETVSTTMAFDPSNVDLTVVDPRDVICYLTFGDGSSDGEEESNRIRAIHLSAVFVLFFTSTLATMFPVTAAKVKWLRIPLYVFLMVRYFGAGVIIATAFIHLLDPAYEAIGPASCVGMTGAWANYSWPPAIAMTSAMFIFLLDFLIECHVQAKLGLDNVQIHGDVEGIVTVAPSPQQEPQQSPADKQQLAVVSSAVMDVDDYDQEKTVTLTQQPPPQEQDKDKLEVLSSSHHSSTSTPQDASLLQKCDAKEKESLLNKLAPFLVLEFGVIFHSVIIGLNLGVASSSEFGPLYVVLVFHQGFEGMGLGARIAVMNFPHHVRVVPWLLCLAYGLTTPVAVAVGLALRSSYTPESFTASVVSGVFDSVSAGILLYTGFVELLARDFLFHPERSSDRYRISFQILCLNFGIAVMALLGKWA